MWQLVLLLLLGLGAAAISGNTMLALAGLVILGIITVLPDPLDPLEYPLLLLYLGIVLSQVLLGGLGLIVDSLMETIVEIGNSLSLALLENPLAFGVGALVALAFLGLVVRAIRESGVRLSTPQNYRRSLPRYRDIEKSVRGWRSWRRR